VWTRDAFCESRAPIQPRPRPCAGDRRIRLRQIDEVDIRERNVPESTARGLKVSNSLAWSKSLQMQGHQQQAKATTHTARFYSKIFVVVTIFSNNLMLWESNPPSCRCVVQRDQRCWEPFWLQVKVVFPSLPSRIYVRISAARPGNSPK
jgi:hypothetical protein